MECGVCNAGRNGAPRLDSLAGTLVGTWMSDGVVLDKLLGGRICVGSGVAFS